MRPLIVFCLLLFSKLGSSQCTYAADTLKVMLNKNIPGFINSLSKEKLITKDSINNLPGIVKNTINCWIKDFSIASLNKPFEKTDAHHHIKLPNRQITYLGVGKHYVVLSYKIGGIALIDQTLLFRFDNDKILDFWGGHSEELRNKRQVLQYLRTIKGKMNTSDFIL